MRYDVKLEVKNINIVELDALISSIYANNIINLSISRVEEESKENIKTEDKKEHTDNKPAPVKTKENIDDYFRYTAEFKAQFKNAEYSIRRFVTECIFLTTPSFMISVEEIYVEYEKYCKRKEIKQMWDLEDFTKILQKYVREWNPNMIYTLDDKIFYGIAIGRINLV